MSSSNIILDNNDKNNDNNNVNNHFGFQIHHTSGAQYYPGNCVIGQLTSVGFKQHINNGINLKHRYSNHYDLLPYFYTNSSVLNEDISLRADNYQRTQQSAIALFTGLYQNHNDNDREYNKQKSHNSHDQSSNVFKSTQTKHLTVNLEINDESTEIIVPNNELCPQHKINIENAVNSQEYQTHFNSITQPLLNQAAQFMFDKNLHNILHLLYTYDCSTVYSCHNYDLPNGFTQSLYDKICGDAAWYINYYNRFPNRVNATKSQIGPLVELVTKRLSETVELLKKVIKNKYNRLPNNDDSAQKYVKFYLYSGHDTGPISPLLGAFGYKLSKWTPYASLISLELFQKRNKQQFYILASYNGETLSLPYPCDSDQNEYKLCTWDAFKKYFRQFIPSEEECPRFKMYS